jgi:TonB family protein
MKAMKTPYCSIAFALILLVGCTTAPAPRETPVANAVRFSGDYFDFSQVDIIPRAIVQVQPIYPRKFRRAGGNGEVVVAFIVGADGAVQQAQVVRATNSEFGDAVLASVVQWRFTPAVKDGRHVPAAMSVPLVFHYGD